MTKRDDLKNSQGLLSQSGNKTFKFRIFLQCSSSGLQIRSVLNTNLIFDFLQDFIESEEGWSRTLFFFFCPRVVVYYSRRSSRLLLIWNSWYSHFSSVSASDLSLQLSEDNNDVRVWFPVAAIMRFFLCLHFVPEGIHLMSWKFFKILFWGCFVTATFSDCGLYLWKLTAPWECVVSPKVRCVTDGLNQIEFYPPVSHLMTREQLSSRSCARSESPDHGGPRRSKNTFYLICGWNYVKISNGPKLTLKWPYLFFVPISKFYIRISCIYTMGHVNLLQKNVLMLE